ncbi:MAG TPA: hypothetical protein IAC49_08795 [Candidatus Ventricola intestinavium]|nr:hypothetical protein [Candidatus Ventricola intestinavium]
MRTNQDTGLIRLIACLCMVIDHAGKMLFPQYPVMRLIGRLAFPLFAYGIAVGIVYTHHPIRYLTRVVLLALVSQPLYALGLAHENSAMYAVSFWEHPLRAAYTFYINSWQTPSILLSLSLGLCILICLRQKRFVLALGVYVLCERFSSSLDYGIGGIRLMLLFYFFLEHPLLCLGVTAGYMIAWASEGVGYVFFGMNFSMRIFALPAVIFACIPMKRHIRLPQWFTYGFYPAHLAVLALLCKL